MKTEPHAEAEVSFLKTENGGRKSSVASGYRGQFFYDNQDWDATQDYPDVERVEPGMNARALLTFITPDPHSGRLKTGMPFLIREGTKIVGYGVLTAVRQF